MWSRGCPRPSPGRKPASGVFGETFRYAVASGSFPSRSTIARFKKRHADQVEMNAHLTRSGIDLALARGHFDPTSIRDSANPQWINLVHSDGTVLKPPSDETFDTAIHPVTGEVWYPKIDVDSLSHKQN